MRTHTAAKESRTHAATPFFSRQHPSAPVFFPALVQAKCACQEEDRLQRKPLAGPAASEDAPPVQAKCTACREEESRIQPKLAMGSPGDPYEREADAMADRVVQRMHVGAMRPMSAPSIQAKCADCLEEERLQRQAEDDDAPDELLQAKADGPMDVPGSVQQALEGGTGGGGTMHPALRDEMESAFEADFSGVRIHTGPSAEHLSRDLSAHAFTYGQDIFFNAGEYRPETPDGRHLLSHELTHVVQQTGATSAPSIAGRHLPSVSRVPLEPEADDLGASAAPGDTIVTSAEPADSSDDESVPFTENAETPEVAVQPKKGRIIQAHAAQGLIQRQPKKTNPTYVPHQVRVTVKMNQETFKVAAMRQIFGTVPPKLKWEGLHDWYLPEKSPYILQVDVQLLKRQRGEASSERGITVGEGGGVAGAEERAKTFDAGPKSDQKSGLLKEIDDRYFKAIGDPTKTTIKPGEKGKAELWRMIRDEVLFQQEYIGNLPPQVKQLIKFSTSGKDLTPADYDKLFAIAKKIEQMPIGQISDYASKVTGTTTDLDVLDASLDKYLAEAAARDKQNQDRDTVHTKLIGLEALYQKYKLWKTLSMSSGFSGMGGLSAGTGIVTVLEAEKVRLELETELQAHDFKGIDDFKAWIDRYELVFEAGAVGIAKDVLANFAGRLYKESERYKDPGEVAALHQKLGGVRASYGEFEANAQIWNDYAKAREEAGQKSRIPGQGHLKTSDFTSTTSSEAEAARTKADAAKAAAQSQVKGMSGDHPIFEEEGLPDDQKLDEVALAKASATQLGGLLQAQVQRRMQQIGEASIQIDEKPQLIYKMEKLMPQFYAQLGIKPGSIHDLIIQDKMKSDVIIKIAKGLAIAIVAIALAVVSFGTAVPAILAAGAAIAGAGLGVFQAYESYQEYVEEKKLADVGFAKDPSPVWLIIAVAGAALDVAAAVKAVSALGKAAKALEAGGDLAEFTRVVKLLEKEQEITAEVARAANKAGAARAAFAEASSELSRAWAKSPSLAGRLTSPEVHEALVKMAREGIKTKVYDAAKLLEEVKLARVKAKLGELPPEELAKVKQAWEEAKILEAAENARYARLFKRIPDKVRLDALIAKAGDTEKLERLLEVFSSTDLETILAQLKNSGRLLTILEHEGVQTGAGMIEGWAREGANGFRKMDQFLERLAAGGKELSETATLTGKSLIIDSNTAIALAKDADPLLRLKLQDGEKAWVAYIKSLPADTELRIANATVGEIKGGVLNVKGVPITVTRESREYENVLKALADQKVGGGGGAADRGLIADALFAKVDNPAVTIPKLVTGDKNMVKNLARMATTAIDVKKIGYPGLAAKYGKTGFEVTIEGRKLMVVPLPVP